MRIDLNSAPQATPQSDRIREKNSSAASNASEFPAQSVEDQAQLFGTHAQVESLAAQASQLPEVREQRVQELRLAVTGGQYQPDAQKIARALVAHMTVARPAQA